MTKRTQKMEKNKNEFLKTELKNKFELRFKTTQESKLQWLQFKILHKILPCNYYMYMHLNKIKIIDSLDAHFAGLTPSC